LINIWDVNTMKIVNTLKGTNSDIRSLKCHNNILISGGKGSLLNGGILSWDLRNTAYKFHFILETIWRKKKKHKKYFPWSMLEM
jgi:hypothetical protein